MNIEINIGLTTTGGQELHLNYARTVFLTVIDPGSVAFRLDAGEWEGKPERTLVAQWEGDGIRPADFVEIARALDQDCVAVYSDEYGGGELFGPNKHGYTFDVTQFKRFNPRASAEAFIAYLEGTLIPAFEADDPYNPTAQDFRTLIHYYRIK